MIRIVNGTDSELHTFYELLRIYFPAYEVSGELFLILHALPGGKRVTLMIGDNQYERVFRSGDEFELKRKISAWIARDVDHPDKEPSMWGSLTGTRPIKFIQKHRRRLGDKGVHRLLTEDYLLSSSLASSLMDIAGRESDLTDHFMGRGYSLYIHIPFCPSRCEYCSYPTIGSDNKEAVKVYVDYLVKELAFVLHKMGCAPETIYMGGGTPTSIPLKELERILVLLKDFAPKEFTLEAGRPKTITKDLLTMIRNYSISRISINPQTMVDRTLKVVKRPHNAQDILDAYALVREYTDLEVNMDTILGLGDENVSDVAYTLEQLSNLDPENITVHMLSLKNGSKLFEKNSVFVKNTRGMQEFALQFLKEKGYRPYYLYRQKRILGNGSNIGYAKVGKECLYNMIMMEEIHTVIGVGMSATTKLVNREGKTLRKFSNFRNMRDYTDRFGEVLRKKAMYLGDIE
ncbi:MAG: coproporphyrinogen dehydrogenase HemZ [Peptoniphilus sp.]|nr:coproporphyrinogen dehydrogenase HemZ [Peptoniphilus sp.]MDY3119186.1 coproporphyrinogen dehydrogenase HemZ [Peptoniphilus sp.]